MVVSRIRRAVRLFLHPRSPAACYRNPYPLFSALVSRSLNLMLRVRNRLFPSHAVVCPVCRWSGSKFGYSSAASVNAFHANDICLGCGANRRTRRMLEVVTDVFDLNRTAVVVDVGAASATRKFFHHREQAQYLTVDLYKESDIRSSITDIDLGEGTADVVMCCHVLEHIIEDQRGIAELHRILKPKGLAILMVPQKAGLAQTQRIPDVTLDGFGHVWDYGDDFPKRVEEVGFVLLSSRAIEGRDPIHVFQK